MPPLVQHAVQTLQHAQALEKAVFLTPYETILSLARNSQLLKSSCLRLIGPLQTPYLDTITLYPIKY